MQVIELLGAGVVLALTLGVGTVAHELTHAVALQVLGVEYDVEWLPERDIVGLFGVGVSRNWATVTPRSIPPGVSTRGLRISAIAPLALAIPIAGVLLGVVPDPMHLDNLAAAAMTVGWFACALPSPQDFSLFWHADQVVDEQAPVGSTDAKASEQQ